MNASMAPFDEDQGVFGQTYTRGLHQAQCAAAQDCSEEEGRQGPFFFGGEEG